MFLLSSWAVSNADILASKTEDDGNELFCCAATLPSSTREVHNGRSQYQSRCWTWLGYVGKLLIVNNYEMMSWLADGEMMKSRGYVVRSYEMMKCQSDCEMMKSRSTKKIEKIGRNLESLILERV